MVALSRVISRSAKVVFWTVRASIVVAMSTTATPATTAGAMAASASSFQSTSEKTRSFICKVFLMSTGDQRVDTREGD